VRVGSVRGVGPDVGLDEGMRVGSVEGIGPDVSVDASVGVVSIEGVGPDAGAGVGSDALGVDATLCTSVCSDTVVVGISISSAGANAISIPLLVCSFSAIVSAFGTSIVCSLVLTTSKLTLTLRVQGETSGTSRLTASAPSFAATFLYSAENLPARFDLSCVL
jgi:hypothetical protein